MTTLSKFGLSSNTSRKVTQPGSSNGMQSRHELAVSGKNMPEEKKKKGRKNRQASEILNQALQNASAYAKKAGQKLDFSIEERFNRTIVTVVDQKTGKIIRQIPMEEMLALANLLSEVEAPGENTILKGLFFDQDT